MQNTTIKQDLLEAAIFFVGLGLAVLAIQVLG